MRKTDVTQAVLFDLDGTLADTAPDMVGALNLLCRERGRPEIPYALARPHVSHGSRALVNLGFPGAAEPDVAALIDRFLEIYGGQLCVGTRVFDDMHIVLESLDRLKIRWGIVTNKPAFLTTPLVASLDLAPRAGCVISGDTLSERKPHAMPLLHACALLGVRPESSLYIGDAERDIVAGRAAGMRTLVASYGYIVDNEDPTTWNADGMISNPREILAWLEAEPPGNESDASAAR